MDILYRSGGDLAGWAGEEPVHDEKIIARPQEDGGWSCIFNQGFVSPRNIFRAMLPAPPIYAGIRYTAIRIVKSASI
jgi:hypothetical protein